MVFDLKLQIETKNLLNVMVFIIFQNVTKMTINF